MCINLEITNFWFGSSDHVEEAEQLLEWVLLRLKTEDRMGD